MGIPEVRLLGWGLVLNGAWEALQTPLYADRSRDLGYLAWSRFHCVLGDLAILLFAFEVTALVFGSRRWWADDRWLPAAVFTGGGFGYTAWSEWFNTRVALAWDYAPGMPRLLGLGLLPLLQWLLIPIALVIILRRAAKKAGAGARKSHVGVLPGECAMEPRPMEDETHAS